MPEDWSKPKDVNDLDAAFPASVIGTLMPEMKEIPEEFHNDNHPWSRFVSNLFFQGGKLPKPKYGIDGLKAKRHLHACLSSWEPQHEHKTAACAWLMSMWYNEPTES